MKIGIDARMYGPEQTGIGTYIQYLIKNLVKYDKTNDYFLFCLKKNKNFIPQQLLSKFKNQEEKIKIKFLNTLWYTLKEQTILPVYLYKENIDLMHFTHFNAPILYQKKFIVTIHDLTPMYWPGHKVGQSHLRKLAYFLVLKNVIYRSCAIIAPSQFTKNDILKYFKINPDKIFVTYEGIKNKLPFKTRRNFLNNLIKKRQDAKEELKNYNLNINYPYILYVGVWRYHKNLVGLIKAFHQLKIKKQIPHKLLICGKEDPFYPEIKKTIQDLRLDQEVILLGLVTGKKLDLIYKGADVYVLPSFHEGFGLTPLEAINQCTPSTVSNIGPMLEILKDSVLYFNPNDTDDMAQKIFNLISDVNLQQKLLLKGQNVLKRYSWKKMAEKTLMIYHSIIG